MNSILQSIINEKRASSIRTGTKMTVANKKSQHHKKKGTFLGFDSHNRTVFIEIDKDNVIEVPFSAVGLEESTHETRVHSLATPEQYGFHKIDWDKVKAALNMYFSRFTFEVGLGGGPHPIASITVLNNDDQEVDWLKLGYCPEEKEVVIRVSPSREFAESGEEDVFLQVVNKIANPKEK